MRDAPVTKGKGKRRASTKAEKAIAESDNFICDDGNDPDYDTDTETPRKKTTLSRVNWTDEMCITALKIKAFEQGKGPAPKEAKLECLKRHGLSKDQFRHKINHLKGNEGYLQFYPSTSTAYLPTTMDGEHSNHSASSRFLVGRHSDTILLTSPASPPIDTSSTSNSSNNDFAFPVVLSVFVPSHRLTCNVPSASSSSGTDTSSHQPRWPRLEGVVHVTRHPVPILPSEPSSINIEETLLTAAAASLDAHLATLPVHVEVQCILVHKSPLGTLFEKTLFAQTLRLVSPSLHGQTDQLTSPALATSRKSYPFAFDFSHRALPPSLLLPTIAARPAVLPATPDAVPRDPVDGGLCPGVHWRIVASLGSPPTNTTVPRPLTSGGLHAIGGLDAASFAAWRPTIPNPSTTPAPTTAATSAALAVLGARTLIKTTLPLLVGYAHPSTAAPWLRPGATASPARPIPALGAAPRAPPGSIAVVSATPHAAPSRIAIVLRCHRDAVSAATLDVALRQSIRLRRPGGRGSVLRRCVVAGVTGVELGRAVCGDAADGDDGDEWVRIEIAVPVAGGRVVDVADLVESAGDDDNEPASSLHPASPVPSAGTESTGDMATTVFSDDDDSAVPVAPAPASLFGVASGRASVSSGRSSATFASLSRRRRPPTRAASVMSTATSSSVIARLFRRGDAGAETTTGLPGVEGGMQLAPSTPAVVSFDGRVAVEVAYVAVVRVRRRVGDGAAGERRGAGWRRLGGRKGPSIRPTASDTTEASRDEDRHRLTNVPSSLSLAALGAVPRIEPPVDVRSASTETTPTEVDRTPVLASDETSTPSLAPPPAQSRPSNPLMLGNPTPSTPGALFRTRSAVLNGAGAHPNGSPTRPSPLRTAASFVSLRGKAGPVIGRIAMPPPFGIDPATAAAAAADGPDSPSTTTLTQPDVLAPLLATTLDDLAMTARHVAALRPIATAAATAKPTAAAKPPADLARFLGTADDDDEDERMRAAATHAAVLLDLVDTFDRFLDRSFVETWAGAAAGGLPRRSLHSPRTEKSGADYFGFKPHAAATRRMSYCESGGAGGGGGVPWPKYLEPFNHVALELEMLLGVEGVEGMFGEGWKLVRSGGEAVRESVATLTEEPEEMGDVEGEGGAVQPKAGDGGAGEPGCVALLTRVLEYLDAVRGLILAWTSSRGMSRVGGAVAYPLVGGVSASAPRRAVVGALPAVVAWTASVARLESRRDAVVEILQVLMAGCGFGHDEDGDEEDEVRGVREVEVEDEDEGGLEVVRKGVARSRGVEGDVFGEKVLGMEGYGGVGEGLGRA
ncbi:hypothetical protein HDU96_010016 [Phlyctochytrium bullatum]|nr:hypothetical protein HDU96_010016 [Phlyctochytrium bullatum]